ncbi:MAG: hypothetical protein MPJ06_07085 [Nitrosopumilus sp.]|nr:hypothetical protein [Nitrosopumilus sp.]
MFWEDHVSGWAGDPAAPRRLVCVIDGEDEHERLAGSAWGATRVADHGWEASPERRMVLTGTRDELLSRALGRGYGTRSQRWSMQMGLLNCDARWVMRRPDPAWEGLAALHQRHGAYNVSCTARGGPAAELPARKLYETDTGAHADIEEHMGSPPPRVADPPRNPGGDGMLSLPEHSSRAEGVMAGICAEIPLGFTPELLQAARYHDWAKSHPRFQDALLAGSGAPRDVHWAKRRPRIRLELDGFYHELVGGCAVSCTGRFPDIVAYLVMVHHGRFHAGVPRVEDELPATPLGGGIEEPGIGFLMEPARWDAISRRLYGRHGPFILLYLEALLRAADMRAG